MSEQDDFSLEVLTDFFDAVEAGISQARQRIKEKKKLKPETDFDKLFWAEKQGKKEPFQQTSEKTNNNSPLWQILKAKLKENKCFWQHDGFKYWFDLQQETVVDRRKTT